MLRYKIAPKCLLPGPFGHSDVGGNPGVAGRFVAIISFLHTPVSLPPPPKKTCQQDQFLIQKGLQYPCNYGHWFWYHYHDLELSNYHRW